MNVEEFGSTLRQAREEKQMTLTDVAKLTGLSVGHISQIETGDSAGTPETIAKIAIAVGLRLTLERSEKWEELHLSDMDIKTAIRSHLESKGYKVRPRTLRLYGYGKAAYPQLTAFQGHIEVKAVETGGES